MSLLKYFSTPQKRKNEEIESESKATKKLKTCTDTVKEKNKKYDNQKRERKFIPHWTDMFTRLVFNKNENEMYCEVCMKYPKLAETNPGQQPVFVTGTDKFRIEAIRSHESSAPHKACQTQFIRETDSEKLPSTKPAATAIGKAIQKIGEKEMEKMRILFNTAYALAYYNKPFSDMEMMCQLMVKNGLDITNYQNKTRAHEFVSQIAETFQNDVKDEILGSRFVSILADGSTDVSVMEQEVTYVRYVANSTVKTQFIAIEDLLTSDAHGVKNGIQNALLKLGLDFQKLSDTKSDEPILVCTNFDGASVMQGRKNGTMGLILADAPWVIPMHRVAHKLELGALDSVKGDSYVHKFEDVVKGIYIFYHYSSKRRCEVKAVAEILDLDFVHISGNKQVRWLASKARTLMALSRNYSAIVSHLQDVSSRKSSEEAARAKGFLRELTSPKFLIMLHGMLDILNILTDLSLVFQQRDLFVFDVYPQIEAHLIRLEELKHDQEPQLKVCVASV